MGRLIIDGNKVYTIDEDCMRKKKLSLTQIKHPKGAETKNDPKSSRQNG